MKGEQKNKKKNSKKKLPKEVPTEEGEESGSVPMFAKVIMGILGVVGVVLVSLVAFQSGKRSVVKTTDDTKNQEISREGKNPVANNLAVDTLNDVDSLNDVANGEVVAPVNTDATIEETAPVADASSSDNINDSVVTLLKEDMEKLDREVDGLLNTDDEFKEVQDTFDQGI